MTVNNLFPLLSAYRKNHSTETALLKITNDILLHKQHVTLLVVLDLSVAFDTTDQDILLDRMSTKLGIEGVVLKWFGSYLKGSSQRVAVHRAVSEKFDLSWGRGSTGLMSWTLVEFLMSSKIIFQMFMVNVCFAR